MSLRRAPLLEARESLLDALSSWLLQGRFRVPPRAPPYGPRAPAAPGMKYLGVISLEPPELGGVVSGELRGRKRPDPGGAVLLPGLAAKAALDGDRAAGAACGAVAQCVGVPRRACSLRPLSWAADTILGACGLVSSGRGASGAVTGIGRLR